MQGDREKATRSGTGDTLPLFIQKHRKGYEGLEISLKTVKVSFWLYFLGISGVRYRNDSVHLCKISRKRPRCALIGACAVNGSNTVITTLCC